MGAMRSEIRAAEASYITQVLCGGNIDECNLPECPDCGAIACLEHLASWYYASPDPRDEELLLS